MGWPHATSGSCAHFWTEGVWAEPRPCCRLSRTSSDTQRLPGTEAPRKPCVSREGRTEPEEACSPAQHSVQPELAVTGAATAPGAGPARMETCRKWDWQEGGLMGRPEWNEAAGLVPSLPPGLSDGLPARGPASYEDGQASSQTHRLSAATTTVMARVWAESACGRVVH